MGEGMHSQVFMGIAAISVLSICLKMETSQGLLVLQRDNFLLEILQINCQVSQLSQERRWKVY